MTSTTPRPPKPFELERFFAKHEFSTPHLLCCSDCEALSVAELLKLADEDCLERWNTLKLGYTESQGLPALREEVAKLYTSIAAEQVVICAPEEGVYLTMEALLQPGDHVVAMRPGYQSLYELAEAKGCKVSFWEPVLTDDAPPTFPIQQLKELVREDTKLVVVNFPHNPTGALPSQAEWIELVEACRSRGAWLFSDEMYRHLEQDPSQQLPSAVDLYDKAIVLCGMSKSLGGAGLRLGWVTSKDATLRQRVLQLKDYTTICAAAPSEVLALIALRAREQIWSQMLGIIADNLKLASSFFQRHSDLFSWHPPAAGPIAFPRLKTGENVEAFCERLSAGCGVLLLPATVYGYEATSSAGHFRFGVGRRNFGECLAVLDAYLTATK